MSIVSIPESINISSPNQRSILFKMGHKLYEAFLLRSYILDADKSVGLLYSMMKHTTDTLPINGNDIKKIGVEPQNIGNILDQAKEIWVKSDFTYNKAELLHAVKRWLLKNP